MRKLSTLLLMALSLVACSDYDYNEIEEENGLIIPLEVGNQWTFIDSLFDESGTFTETRTMKVGITGKSSLDFDGETVNMFWWNWHKMPEDTPNDYWWLVAGDEEGHHYYGGMTPIDTFLLTKSMKFKYPVEKNDQWMHESSSAVMSDSVTFEMNDPISISCSETQKSIETPAGTFTCYGYSEENATDDGTLRKTSYLSPGIGYVKIENWVDGIKKWTRTLQSTNVSK